MRCLLEHEGVHSIVLEKWMLLDRSTRLMQRIWNLMFVTKSVVNEAGISTVFLETADQKAFDTLSGLGSHVSSGTTDLQLLDYYWHFQCYDFQGNYLSWNLNPRRH